MIYHIVSKADWQQAVASGVYEAPSLSAEGFIHLSQQQQVAGVLQRYYQNQKELLLLHVEENMLTAPLKYEMAPSVNEVFPHLFGPLNLDAVVAITAIE